MRIVGALRGTEVQLPSLAAVRKIQIGVTNLSDHTIQSVSSAKDMQIWFDELRLEDVRNIAGTAVRGNPEHQGR